MPCICKELNLQVPPPFIMLLDSFFFKKIYMKAPVCAVIIQEVSQEQGRICQTSLSPQVQEQECNPLQEPIHLIHSQKWAQLLPSAGESQVHRRKAIRHHTTGHSPQITPLRCEWREVSTIPLSLVQKPEHGISERIDTSWSIRNKQVIWYHAEIFFCIISANLLIVYHCCIFTPSAHLSLFFTMMMAQFLLSSSHPSFHTLACYSVEPILAVVIQRLFCEVQHFYVSSRRQSRTS